MKKLTILVATLFATVVMAQDGKALYTKCVACHGVKAEKKALNKGQIIQGWDKAKLVASMKGYKDGSYGGAMKGLMKGQLATYDDAKIEAVAEYITTLK